MMDTYKMQAHIICQLQKTLLIDNAANRVAGYILWMMKEKGIHRGGGIEIPRTLSFEKIAEALFMSRETATRMFARLKKEGIIDITDEHFIILDAKKLTDYSDSNEILTGYYGTV